MDDLGVEIAKIALPAALALTADPIASLVDTAFIGQIGAIELAAVGVSIAVFNQVSRIAIFPLVSITTSFVAEEDAVSNSSNENLEMHEQTENKMLLQQEHKSNMLQTLIPL
ncbi:putative multi antimicrobial extrusion protein DinF [Helianthus annuus]|nr:putative multi antimicrobial extrusion protein DinF [Helianthus annuus]